uniref:Uncharacterized protein n=1 Tax=Romanomermis culicivorax TaxID=13658 RepID=A0A915IU67_ROMCU
MSLVDGIDELRHVISKPKDALFGQLTDLIVALNDASMPSSSSKHTTLQYKGFFGAPDISDSEKELSNHNTSSATLVNNSSPAAKPKTIVGGANNNSGGLIGSVSASEKPTWHVTMISRQHDNHIHETTTKWKFFRHQKASGGGVNAAAGHPPVESDSFPETWTPARRNRRKRLIKRMAVDVSTNNTFVESGEIYHYEGMDIENTNKMNIFRQNMSRIRRSPSRCSGKHLFLSSNRPMITYLGRNSESNMEYDYDINLCGTSESEGSVTSDEEGHQGDDEQSDWYFEIPDCSERKCGKYDPTSSTNRLEDRSLSSDNRDRKNPDDCVMGIPDIRKMMMQKLSKQQAIDLNSYIQTIESSDTDISQSSINLRCSTKIFGKRLLTKNVPAMTSALNKRIVTFLQYPLDSELPLGHLKKRERKEALRLASFYNLDVCCQASGYTHMYTLTKTKYTLKP